MKEFQLSIYTIRLKSNQKVRISYFHEENKNQIKNELLISSQIAKELLFPVRKYFFLLEHSHPVNYRMIKFWKKSVKGKTLASTVNIYISIYTCILLAVVFLMVKKDSGSVFDCIIQKKKKQMHWITVTVMILVFKCCVIFKTIVVFLNKYRVIFSSTCRFKGKRLFYFIRLFVCFLFIKNFFFEVITNFY